MLHVNRNKIMLYNFLETPIGKITLAGNTEALTNLYLNNKMISPTIPSNWKYKPDAFIEVRQQITEYFLGARFSFDVQLILQGSNFQQKVWNIIASIPYGETFSYKKIAALIGHPNAFRAVGNAANKNPIPIIIPCHRVIGNSGKLTGYAYGITIKKKLLDNEQLWRKK